MKTRLSDKELNQLALIQLELFIRKGQHVEQCKAEWERRMGRKYDGQ